jgi:hypothetical protein
MIVDNEIQKLNTVYDSVRVDKYCIMPDHIHFIILTIWKLIELICGEPATDFILKRSMALRAWGYYLAVGIARFSFSPLLLLGNISFLEEDLFFMGGSPFVTNGDLRKRYTDFSKNDPYPCASGFRPADGK